MVIAARCSYAVRIDEAHAGPVIISKTGGGVVAVAAAVGRHVRVQVRSEGGRAVGGTGSLGGETADAAISVISPEFGHQ